MRRYKIIVEISVDAETEADAIWAATEAALSGEAVAACSAESAEAVPVNYRVKGRNAMNRHEYIRAKCRAAQLGRKVLAEKRKQRRKELGISGWGKPVIATRLADGKKELYPTIRLAAAAVGGSQDTIGRTLKGCYGHNTAAGRTWEYAPVGATAAESLDKASNAV